MAWAPKLARSNDELVRLFNENMRGIESELARRPQASTTETKIRTLPIASPIVGLQLGEASTTAYRGDRGKTAYDHSQATGNPHGAVAADVGAASALHASQHGYGASDPVSIDTRQISNMTPFIRTLADDATAAEARTTLGAAASTHAHGSVTTGGKIGSTAGLPVTTGTGGALQAVAWSTTSPAMNGTASVGSSAVPSRSDHVHPIDTSRAPSTAILANNAASSTMPTVGTATTLATLLQQIRDYLVGLTAKFTDGSVTKVGAASVGSTTQPIYLNSGVPTAITGAIGNSTTGNAATATKLATARAIALTGDVVGSASFDGSANSSIAVTSAHLEANTGTYVPWKTKGSKNNYTGISAPGALIVNFMSNTSQNFAGLYCETDSKWIVLRNSDGTVKTDYTPVNGNSNEIATTAFVNSRINAQPQEYFLSIYNSASTMMYTTGAFVILCNLVANQVHHAEALLSFSVCGNTTAANNYAGRVYMGCKAQGTTPTYNVQILEGTSNIDNLLKWRSNQGASTIYCTIMFAIPAYSTLNVKLDSLTGGGTWSSDVNTALQSAWLTYGTMLTYIAPNADKIDGKHVVVTGIASRGTDANTLYFCY